MMVAVLLVACAASVGLGMRIANPRQLAAAASAPQLGHLTAAVGQQVVSQTVSLSASPGGGELSILATGREDASLLVVTGLSVKPGDRVAAGRAVAVVSGRPVIALAGKLPAYRDLTPGMVGPDVHQLRQALADIGLLTTHDRRDWFGPSTQSAVAALYARVGFEPVLTSATALSDRAKASHELGGADLALTRIMLHGSHEEILAARATRDTAKESLTTLEGSSGITLPRAEVFYLLSSRPQVASVKARIGQQIAAGGIILSLNVGTPTLLGTVDPAVLAQLVPGMHGQARDPNTGTSWSVTTVPLPAAGQNPAADPASTAGNTNGSEAPDQGEASTSQGGNVALALPAGVSPNTLPPQVEVTVTIRRTPAKVLAVPSTAISTTVSGQTWLDLVGPGDVVVRIPVKVGLSGGGLVEVSSSDPRLRKGSRVVVGRAAAS